MAAFHFGKEVISIHVIGLSIFLFFLSLLKHYFIIHKNINWISIDIVLEIMHAIGTQIRVSTANDSPFDINISPKGYWDFNAY